MLTLDQAFAHIAQNLSSYEIRTAQRDLARAIERGLAEGLPVLAEAGTGTGKSFAALIPAILSGKRVVVSTATIALQEQYIHKDIPFLQKALPISFRAELVKGRGHYLSKRRWSEYLLAQTVSPEIKHWVATTSIGDQAELSVTPPPAVWEEIRSDKDDCLREQCPFYRECFYYQNRRDLAQAQILVTNHAFLLADLASGRQLLPSHELVVIDEAHQFSDIATRALTLEVSNLGLRRLFSRIQKFFNPGPVLIQAEISANELFSYLLDQPKTASRRWNVDGALVGNLYLRLGTLADHLRELRLDQGMRPQDLQVAQMRRDRTVDLLLGHCGTLNTLMSQEDTWVRWVDYAPANPGKRITLCAASLDLSAQLREFFFQPELPTSVWMSATLTTGASDAFSYFRSQIGLGTGMALEQGFESPFDFAAQALLYLPQANLPEPNHPDFLYQSLTVIAELIHASGGCAFVLFTSSTAMRYCHESLCEQIPFPSKVQGAMPRRQLLEWFRHTPQAVLFATASFWEGVSIEGDQLRLVIIDRIPFQSPGDPVYDARAERLKRESGDWFSDLALPYAALKLKQGAGRLIRTRNDRGVVAILDPRMTRKSYGRILIRSLPPFRVSTNPQDLGPYFRSEGSV